jgi:hypothetical protein
MVPRGEVLSAHRVWEWGKLWYRDRLSLEWRPKTRETMREIFAKMGFQGEFWQLPA